MERMGKYRKIRRVGQRDNITVMQNCTHFYFTSLSLSTLLFCVLRAFFHFRYAHGDLREKSRARGRNRCPNRTGNYLSGRITRVPVNVKSNANRGFVIEHPRRTFNSATDSQNVRCVMFISLDIYTIYVLRSFANPDCNCRISYRHYALRESR